VAAVRRHRIALREAVGCRSRNGRHEGAHVLCLGGNADFIDALVARWAISTARTTIGVAEAQQLRAIRAVAVPVLCVAVGGHCILAIAAVATSAQGVGASDRGVAAVSAGHEELRLALGGGGHRAASVRAACAILGLGDADRKHQRNRDDKKETGHV